MHFPCRYLFFTTLGESPRIVRSLLDGSKVVALVKEQRIVRPQALTLDYVNKHVYWADNYLDRLERINYDGTGRKLIRKKLWVSVSYYSQCSD